jgi:hypothetical protein
VDLSINYIPHTAEYILKGGGKNPVLSGFGDDLWQNYIINIEL